MTLNEYQEAAERTIDRNLVPPDRLAHALHTIAAECGEIHGVFQKRFQGHRVEYDALLLEIGDLMWGIAELCTVLGEDMDNVAQMNIDKLKRRYPNGFEAEKSLHREV